MVLVLPQCSNDSGKAEKKSPSPTPAIVATPGQIIFTSNQDGENFDIYLMESDGSNVRNLTQNAEINGEPGWSPDGSRIVFISAPYTFAPNDIYVMNADGSDLHALTPPDDEVSATRPTWSPDGTKIAYMHSGSDGHMVCLMNADGSNVQVLTPDLGDAAGVLNRLSWSPDGKRLTFSGEPEPDGKSDIFVVNADGTDFRNLTHAEGNDLLPFWSPMGDQIVYMSDRDSNYQFEINVINADGSNFRTLTDTLDVNHRAPVWSPDGRQLVFTTYNRDEGTTCINVMAIEGGDARCVVTDEKSLYGPRWSPDGKLIFYIKILEMEPTDRNILAVSVDGGDPVTLAPFETWEDEPDQWLPQ